MFEIQRYKSLPPFNGEYYAIFRDGVKTNFWADVDDQKGIDALHKYQSLLTNGIIDAQADDSCASVTWKPKNIRSVIWVELNDKEYNAIRSQWPHTISSVSGNETKGKEQEYIDRGKNEVHTQYCKILRDDLSGLLENLLVVIYPYGATYIAE